MNAASFSSEIREGLGVTPRATRLVISKPPQSSRCERVMEVLPREVWRARLDDHLDKTQLVPFRPPSLDDGRPRRAKSVPGRLTCFGFTHYWGRSQRGYLVIKQRRQPDRFSRAVREHRLAGVEIIGTLVAQGATAEVKREATGHYACATMASRGTRAALARSLSAVKTCWRKWLHRRNRLRLADLGPFTACSSRYPLAPVRASRLHLPMAAKP